MLEVYDQVMEIMLPSLGPERRKTYSPFLPVCPKTGPVCCRCRCIERKLAMPGPSSTRT